MVGWIDVFTRELYCEEIIKNLQYCQNHKGLEIYAYCLMPSHLHLVVAVKEGRLGDVLRDYKGYTSKQIIQLIEENPQEFAKNGFYTCFLILRNIIATTQNISFGNIVMMRLTYLLMQ